MRKNAKSAPPPPDKPRVKPLSWARARRRREATEHIHVSLDGDEDRVMCSKCDESITLLYVDAEGNDRNAQLVAFSRMHYERHPIMVEVPA